MYGSCGRLEEAAEAFERIGLRNVFSYSILISAYVHNGRPKAAVSTFRRMDLEGISTDHVSFLGVLAALSSTEEDARPSALSQGKFLHSRILQSGFGSKVWLGNAIVTMYGKLGSLVDAKRAFDAMQRRDTISWNAMISAYSEHGMNREALELYEELVSGGAGGGVKPDDTTFATVLGCCSCLEHGKQIHELLVSRGFESDVFVCNSLINMYARCGSLEEARRVFDGMQSNKNTVTWNIMISGYAENGEGKQAAALFEQMKQDGTVKPDHITYINVLSGCTTLEEGVQIHEQAGAAGVDSVGTVANAVLSMYTRCGEMEAAIEAFDKMKFRDVVSWNGMIAGCTQQGHYRKALDYFRGMDLEGLRAGEGTFSCVLSACAGLGALGEGKRMHRRVIASGYELSTGVANTLIHMYGKCGRLEQAQEIFDRVEDKTVVPWNALIAAYAQHGYGKQALDLFHRMDVEPNAITFSGVLHACCHAGLVDEGCRYFGSMVTDHAITPSEEHYRMVVDLLARVGKLEDAEKFLNRMPCPAGAVSWRALLGACRLQGDSERGVRAADKIMELEPQHSSPYVLLSNIYSAAGRFEEAARVRKLMERKGVTKMAGWSSIEVKDRVHVFLSGDTSHPKNEEIRCTLRKLSRDIEKAGYIPDTGQVVQQDNVGDEGMLSYHSEKLAIAFGIMSSPAGSPLQIVKNLRVCTDCHSATKFISKIAGRRIIVRDANRFHRFEDGQCSCSDFW